MTAEPKTYQPVDLHLTLDLPPEMAETMERYKRSEPELLKQMIVYGMTRKVIFDSLVQGSAS
ncbi:MAG TPA: hypothetical protein VFD97_03160 [Acidimicrobiia bacterium]|nr:hypothetical protein [Acidimicrobiia bacterium]